MSGAGLNARDYPFASCVHAGEFFQPDGTRPPSEGS